MHPAARTQLFGTSRFALSALVCVPRHLLDAKLDRANSRTFLPAEMPQIPGMIFCRISAGRVNPRKASGKISKSVVKPGMERFCRVEEKVACRARPRAEMRSVDARAALHLWRDAEAPLNSLEEAFE
jgi:hypothetical protein